MTFNPVVRTKYGSLHGYPDERDTLVWKAIPYARPPVGNLRWKAPGDPDPWDGVRENTEFECSAPMGVSGGSGLQNMPIAPNEKGRVEITMPCRMLSNNPCLFLFELPSESQKADQAGTQ